MNKKITLLVLLGCVVCVAALALTVDVAGTALFNLRWKL